MVIANFQMKDKVDILQYFQKIFLIANTKFEITLGMFFLKLSNTNMSFSKIILIQKTYTINKTLPIIKQVQIIDKKDFIITVLNTNSKILMVYIIISEQEKIPIYFKKQTQIKV